MYVFQKISDFKSGNWVKQNNYKAFIPSKVNLQWVIDSPKLEALIARAHQHLGELNAFSELIPDVDFFIKMHIAKEATLSSKIEGTQTSMEEAFLNKRDIKPAERNDWEEVQNYINATHFAIERLESLPISNRLIRETHHVLLQGVRGQNKQPGEFRRSQNWIGGATLSDARFIPPPPQEIPALMGDLELFLHNDDIYLSSLVRVAIAHYQFETIHPFLDGNGRMGRLLITLYLMSEQVLSRPSLYLSDFFEKHRQLYFDNLSAVRKGNELEHWLTFFMVGVIETAKSSVATFRAITALKENIEVKAASLGRKRQNGRRLLKHLFSQPVVTAQELPKILELSLPSVNSLINDFEKLGILEERTGFHRNRIFSFKQYIDLF